MTANPALIESTILAELGKLPPGKTLTAEDVARRLADPDWHALMVPVRRAAVALAVAGRLVIYRKGKPVEDPTDFKGVWRMGLPNMGLPNMGLPKQD